MTVPEITVRGAKEAYGSAGVGPEDIDVAEIHDAFSIAELLYYEAFGFCGRGEAIGLLEDGVTSLGGAKPVNPSGGLLSKGHPVGATGVAQITEIVGQLRGMCGPRQVDGARTGLAHATGGGAMGMDHGACSIHILQS
jgi:benzoylsuccinyl-CoA thiolase BbsB subunit